MRTGLVSAAIVAAVALPYAGARAEDAPCDLMCRFQTYISSDHMAGTAAGGDTSSPKAAAKRPVRAAAARTRKPKEARTVADAPKSARIATAPARPSAPPPAAKTAAGPAHDNVPVPEAVAARPDPTVKSAATPAPRKRHVAAISAMPDHPSVPAAASAPLHPPRTAARPVQRAAAQPVARADLIPGSARLVPAEFQRFGDF